MVYLEIAIVVVLICVNGLLAMSELAIVSARPARLKAMIDRDVKGAGRALALGANPGRFLSTVQIGITLVGVLSGAFSGATLGHRLTEILMAWGMSAGRSQSARRRRRRGRHHLRLADRRRAGAQADRAARSRGHRRHGRAGHDHPVQGGRCRSSSCSIFPAAPSCGCSASMARARRRSPTRRSRCWSPRPSITAPSNPTSAA